MVNVFDDSLAVSFAALSDPTHRAIVDRLAQGDASVTGLARPFALSLPAMFKQLRGLERAGLLNQKRLGRVSLCHLEAEPMRESKE